MSTGAITYPIKLSEAINLYSKNKTFTQMSIRKQQEYLQPFKVMDLMEEELKNLDVVNSSDQLSNTLKIVRRNQAIQKDFFSMAEYLVWAVNQYIENDFYKRRKQRSKERRIAFFD